MELAFANKGIRAICEDEYQAKDVYGVALAVKLQARLADMISARSVTELLAGRPEEVIIDSVSKYKVDLCDGYRLIFCSNHVKTKSDEGSSLDWSRVRRIKILQIEKTNG